MRMKLQINFPTTKTCSKSHSHNLHAPFYQKFVLLLLFFGIQLIFSFPFQAYAKTKDSDLYELIMQWPSSDSTPTGLSDVEKALNEITEPAIGVTVRLKATSNPVFETNLAVSSGEKLDLSLALYGRMPSLVSNGYLMPLDDLIDQYGQEVKNACGVQLKGGYYQNQLYGIPPVYSEGQRYGFICRTDMMEKYGFQLEEGKYYTFDELEDFFCRVKEGEGEDFYILGGSMASKAGLLEKSCYAFDVLGSQINTGVLMLNPDTGLTSTSISTCNQVMDFYETKEFMDFARRMYRWDQKGFFYPNTSISEEDSNIMMRDNKILGWFFHNVPGEEVENASKSGLEVTFIPTREAIRTTDVNQNVLWSIPTTCENPEKVIEFLNLLYTDETVSNLLQRGIEGKSYVVVEENENGKLIDFPEGMDITTIPYYVNGGVYGNRLCAYTWVPGDINHNQIVKEFSDQVSLTSPAWGYVFDSEKVSVQIAQVEQVVQKYIGIIETGAVDPEIEVPMFLQELKAAGIDQIIEENQCQYDIWKKQQ